MEIRKIVASIPYRCAHGYNVEHMADRLKIGASTIKKYVDIICDMLTDGDKLFSHYISIPSRNRLLSIILNFKETTGLPNICGTIDGHIYRY